jgi:hypothetical protein
MRLDEYVNRQAGIIARIVRLFLALLTPFRNQTVSPGVWRGILLAAFPAIRDARNESAQLAREFYDSERDRFYNDRHDVNLAPDYEFDWLLEAMSPSEDQFKVIDTTENAVVQAAMRVAKEVENGGRRTLLQAVDSDDRAIGFARVATGRETCAFCLMLVSRGPVYKTFESAGGSGDYRDDFMKKWHPNCDCKVVPVFDRANWPGRQAYEEALEMWREYTRGYSGRDALNALRRAIDHNHIDEADLAAA